jgi:uncharacterized membrane protein
MSLFNVFVGVPQSKLAGTAILIAVIVVGLTTLFGKGAVPTGQKLVVALVMFLLSLPAILLTLFQLNCMVTGAGFKNQRWWCGLYAWFVSLMILFYSAVLVIVALMNMVNDKAVEKFQDVQDEATKQAKEYFETQEAKVEIKGPVMEEPPVPEMPEMMNGEESGLEGMEPETFTCSGAPL